MNLPLEGVFLAAVKAGGQRAVLSHFSAASLWGMVEWDGRMPEISVLGRGTRSRPGLRVHLTEAMTKADMRRRDGIPVTSPARTLVDLASEVEYRALRRAVRQAQSLRLLHLRELTQVLDRLGRRRGIVNLRRVVADGSVPTRSVLEDVVLDLVTGGGLVRPDVNVPLVLSGRRVIPDFRWPQQRLVLEADGAAWHDNRIAREDDAERQELLEAHGERVVRVTWEQAVARPAEVLTRLRAAGAPCS